MQDWIVGDFVAFSDKTLKNGKIVGINSKTVIIDLLEPFEKAKNSHLKRLLDNEMILTPKKLEIQLSKIHSKLNVLFFSDFIFKFYQKNISNFDHELIKSENAIILRYNY